MSSACVFDKLVVRPVRKGEVSRWNSSMQKHHYLGLKWIAGKSLRYIALLDGEWVALLGWGSASKNCGARERYIGWSGEKKYKGLFLIANNLRFLILPWISQKNLASKVLSLNLKRLSADFQRVYGHPIYLAETFVDESKFKGTYYKASNWKYVGHTEGYSRSNTHYYHHGQVKAVYLYCLYKRAREILSGDLIPYDVSLLKEQRRLSTMIKFPISSREIDMADTRDYRPTEFTWEAASFRNGIIHCGLCGSMWLLGLSFHRGLVSKPFM